MHLTKHPSAFARSCLKATRVGTIARRQGPRVLEQIRRAKANIQYVATRQIHSAVAKLLKTHKQLLKLTSYFCKVRSVAGDFEHLTATIASTSWACGKLSESALKTKHLPVSVFIMRAGFAGTSALNPKTGCQPKLSLSDVKPTEDANIVAQNSCSNHRFSKYLLNTHLKPLKTMVQEKQLRFSFSVPKIDFEQRLKGCPISITVHKASLSYAKNAGHVTKIEACAVAANALLSLGEQHKTNVKRFGLLGALVFAKQRKFFIGCNELLQAAVAKQAPKTNLLLALRFFRHHWNHRFALSKLLRLINTYVAKTKLRFED